MTGKTKRTRFPATKVLRVGLLLIALWAWSRLWAQPDASFVKAKAPGGFGGSIFVSIEDLVAGNR